MTSSCHVTFRKSNNLVLMNIKSWYLDITLETVSAKIYLLNLKSCSSTVCRESVLLISALLKCLIYAILENCSYDKAMPKLLYWPSVFVFFINVGHFIILEIYLFIWLLLFILVIHLKISYLVISEIDAS